QPRDRSINGTVQGNAALERSNEPLAIGHQAEGPYSLGRLQNLCRSAYPIVPVQSPALDVRPPQHLAPRIPENSLAQHVLDGEYRHWRRGWLIHGLSPGACRGFGIAYILRPERASGRLLRHHEDVDPVVAGVAGIGREPARTVEIQTVAARGRG